MSSFPANWIAAARHERDRREDNFPKLIADGKIPLGPAEANYQAWCAITEWLEQGKSSWLTTMLGWPALEDAAEKQLADLDERLARPERAATKAAALREHRDAVWCIHNTLVKQRELIAPTSREDTAWARPPRAAATVEA